MSMMRPVGVKVDPRGFDYEMVELADGVWTCLLHHDYPAPVRCEPDGSEFAAKAGSDKDSQDGEYQRVQYDLVVLIRLI